ncbi:MAG: hypothetical protein KBD78_03050 [Oligoflexales bacterium]|nr:hypothetical protein [Oligoflexales bacterium]
MPEALRLYSQTTSQMHEITQLLEAIEDNSATQNLISQITQQSDADSIARLLIESFYYSMWRDIKFKLIGLLGNIESKRARDFLIDKTNLAHDLPMSRQACLALGRHKHLSAGFFLSRIASNHNHPLHREAIESLSQNLMFSDYHFLNKQIFDENLKPTSPLFIHYLSAMSCSRSLDFYPKLLQLIEAEFSQLDSALQQNILMTLSRIGGKQAVEFIDRQSKANDFFTKNLSHIVKEKIHLRLNVKIDDVLLQLTNINDPNTEESLLMTLREFPRKKAWEAYLTIQESFQKSQELMIRISLFTSERSDEDCKFLLENWNYISDAKYCLIRLHSDIDRNFLIKILADISILDLISLAENVAYKEISTKLITVFESELINNNVRISIINCLVTQIKLLSHCDSESVQMIKDHLTKHFLDSNSIEIRSRLLRALGQVFFENDAIYTALTKYIANEQELSSIYEYLGRLSSQRALLYIEKQLKRLNKKSIEQSYIELTLALKALSRFEHFSDNFLVAINIKEEDSDHEKYYLKILGLITEKNSAKVIEKYLKSNIFEFKMLAIAAARLNMSENISSLLNEQLCETNKAIVQRSIDSLSRSGKKYCHKILFEQFIYKEAKTEIIDKIARSLIPEPGKDYSLMVDRLDKLIANQVFIEKHNQVLEPLILLRDQLSLQSQISTQNTKNTGELKSHILDAKIISELNCFDHLSEDIKSAIRNSAAVFSMPQLFDQKVDKSTIIVQYVKAIDLLLQDKIGSVLFGGRQDFFLTQMQATIYKLKFDNQFVDKSEVLNLLQCESYFKANNFPYFKFTNLCSDIISGKLMQQPSRSIDGIKAWALLILLFARDLKIHGQKISGILNCSDRSQSTLLPLVVSMMQLQDTRNEAAHRGTISDLVQLEAIKKLTYQILVSINQVF